MGIRIRVPVSALRVSAEPSRRMTKRDWWQAEALQNNGSNNMFGFCNTSGKDWSRSFVWSNSSPALSNTTPSPFRCQQTERAASEVADNVVPKGFSHTPFTRAASVTHRVLLFFFFFFLLLILIVFSLLFVLVVRVYGFTRFTELNTQPLSGVVTKLTHCFFYFWSCAH